MDAKRMSIILAVLAVAILVSSCATFAYNLVPKGDTSKVIVNGTEYTWSEIFGGSFFVTAFEVEGKDFTDEFEGVELADLVIYAGVNGVEDRDYIVSSADGYQATVNWSSISSGYLVLDGEGLVNDKITVFPGLPQRYWVYDVVEIEVV